MVKVYRAKVTNAERAETTVTPHKGTLEWIKMLRGGEPILETAQEVESRYLDGQGRYIPQIEEANAQRS